MLGGFAFSDTSKNGLHVIVTARGSGQPALDLCREIAALGWANRDRFVCEAASIEAAVESAVESAVAAAVARAMATGADTSAPPMLSADLGDNCGAGGLANTLWLLEAFHAAGAEGVHVAGAEGVHVAGFCDPALTGRAHAAGIGARMAARFAGDDWGRAEDSVCSAEVVVLALHDGPLVGRPGTVAGRRVQVGRMALLQAGPVQVPVTDRRIRFNDPVLLEAPGVDIAALRGLAAGPGGQAARDLSHGP